MKTVLSQKSSTIFVRDTPLSKEHRRCEIVWECDAEKAQSSTEAVLSEAQLTSVPDGIFNLFNLRALDLSRNYLARLPDSQMWGQLGCLEELNVSHNQLSVLPESLGRCPLRLLNLRSNQFKSLEKNQKILSTLTGLRHLDLRYQHHKLGALDQAGIKALFPELTELAVVLCGKEEAEAKSDYTTTMIGDGPDGGWPTLEAQLTPWSTPILRERLRTLFGIHVAADIGRKALMESLVAAYCEAPIAQGEGFVLDPARVRREIAGEGVLISTEMYDHLLRVLRGTEWPNERARAKVEAQRYLVLERPPPEATGESKGAKQAKRKREAFPELWNAVVALGESLDPTFYFTGVAISSQFRGSPHMDGFDISHQWAISLGDFEGGELCVECEPDTIAVINTKGRAAKVDGRYPHWVAPYRGERYSVILFKTRGVGTPVGPAWFPPAP